MATYIIGDVQGCYEPLQRLLTKINFDPKKDVLWLAGDIVNRGPQSLEVLRFMHDLGEPHGMVLGNHDLHLLAIAYGIRPEKTEDTLGSILTAPDRDELIAFLLKQPFLHYDDENKIVLTHAGLAPQWSLPQAIALAKEVETALRCDPKKFLHDMYGNQPDQWQDNLTGSARLRCIVNYFTRMRFCYPDGRLELSVKGAIDPTSHLLPWFDVPTRVNKNAKIVFGHWAALKGETHTPHIFAIDTGCVWGECLTAIRLQDEKRIAICCGEEEK